MSDTLETRIDGSPDAIESIGVFFSNTVAGHAETLGTDISSARTKVLDGWTGTAADAFGSTTQTAKTATDTYREDVASLAGAVKTLGTALDDAQKTMADARATAVDGGLTVSGTQIHGPGAAPNTQLPSDATTEEVDAAQDAVDAYNAKVTLWNGLVDTVDGANQRWEEALNDFATTWKSAAGNLASVTTSFITAGASASALANSAYRLKSTVLLNQERLATAQKNLADAVKDGRVILSKDDVYAFMDDAAKAKNVVADSTSKLESGLKVGSKLSKGLLVLGIAGTAYGIYDDMQNGESAAQAVASNGGGFVAGLAAGAGAGAIVGSFIAPPAGTIAGAAVGAIVGGAVGIFTSGAIDHLFEGAADGVAGTLKAGWDEVADTGEAIGDLASGAWHAVFG
ncbi:hypothetical protein PU630_15235 [Microbacterium horticulturae]|uniref:WXG100 family type VII secretion target n=1 Tax=Microbacterium horticulturae TaxID=3028316 RepID=A0ABY8BWN9_9MICO|nr:hypothetical protein [Microbacterium sp. KACC 23027]WEG08579.1 hypothetical protein PU630_15235 [Microbacterium sp. KACC 23027]